MIPHVMFGRGILSLSLLAFTVLQFTWHAAYRQCLCLPGLAQRVLILGTGPLAKQIGSLLPQASEDYVLAGYVNCVMEQVSVPACNIVENGSGLLDTVRKSKANKIVVSLSERRGAFPLKDVLCCKLSGVQVVDAPSFYEEVTGKLLIENITPSWFIFSDGFKVTPLRRTGKRGLDIVLALIGLALSFPLFPVIALLIAVDSRGPVFFRQVRVGEKERPFVLFKFRTMRADAEKGSGAVWAQKNDPRITRMGKLLRKTRLDELPQLYNVLIGDMSFVGPRPERPEFVEQLTKIIPYYSERHFVKPGITGWAQIKYAYGSSVEDAIEKLRYDLYYIKNLGLFLDMLIILETVKVVLFGRGAR